ncbi:hypothetical protein [Allobranchiibius huperziae]|uniref:Carbamoyl-phosphate synthase large subunit n=1 Tax=Allobranchiibius huperziae TaxID=1874116 RepID=A0A853DDP6_9MICO|nr:hypothetical protein [Allobranchiibius huperziae]NYJ75532.1 carbamoyl-phosphate synthase large subunit [Allobranchiibius huperziae]
MSEHQPHANYGRETPQFTAGRRRILVTGAEGAAGHVLVEQLATRGLQVHCADSRPMCLPSAVCHLMPEPTNPGFLPALARIVQRYGIDLVIPASSDALPAISVGRLSLGVDVVVPGPGPTGTAHDRLLTAWSLRSHGVGVPDFGVPSDFADAEDALDAMGGQLTLRSRWASGAQAATVLNGSDDVDWSAMSDDWFVQRFVPGPAYSVVLYRPLDGKGRLSTVLEESVRDDTEATMTLVGDDHAVGVEGVARAAVRALGLTGPLEVGVRRGADGLPMVLDVQACFGPHSGLNPEMLDAVLRDHPAPPSSGVRRHGNAPGAPVELRSRTARVEGA